MCSLIPRFRSSASIPGSTRDFSVICRPFSIGGRTANLLLELPYSWGTTKGLVGEAPARRDFAGMNDAGITVAVNLLGGPSMSPAEFQELRANPRPILGASLKLVPPSGYYDSNRLINVGANR
jgi:hypothetical protein